VVRKFSRKTHDPIIGQGSRDKDLHI
jgi:hypothetical protein